MSRLRLASLGMYDFPWLHAANDALWLAIARRLTDAGLSGVPVRLARDRPLEALWRDPDLLLAQTCGYPLRTRLAGSLRVVATPRYAVPHARGSWHRSVLVVPEAAPWRGVGELRGRTAALNAYDSNTGMNLLRAAVAPYAEGQPFFARVLETGSHLASLAALVRGEAQVAAIDCVSLALIARHCPEHLQGVRMLALSPESPGLPLVAPAAIDERELGIIRDALQEVAADPGLAGVRAALALDGFELLPEETYDRVLELEREAADWDYPALV